MPDSLEKWQLFIWYHAPAKLEQDILTWLVYVEKQLGIRGECFLREDKDKNGNTRITFMETYRDVDEHFSNQLETLASKQDWFNNLSTSRRCEAFKVCSGSGNPGIPLKAAKNRITVTLPFSFKGNCFSPSCTIDLDEHHKLNSIPCLYTHLADENGIDVYSHEYDVMMMGQLEFSNPEGLAADFLHDGYFDIEGFREAKCKK